MSDLVKLLRESFVAYSKKGKKVRSFRVREDITPGDRERIADELERLEQENKSLHAKTENFNRMQEDYLKLVYDYEHVAKDKIVSLEAKLEAKVGE